MQQISSPRAALERQLAATAAKVSLGSSYKAWTEAGHTAVHLANLDRLFVLYSFQAGMPVIVQVYEVTSIAVDDCGLKLDVTDSDGWTTTISHAAAELDSPEKEEGYGVFIHIPFMAETSYKPSLSDPDKYIFKVPICVKQKNHYNFTEDGVKYFLPAVEFKQNFPELASEVF